MKIKVLLVAIVLSVICVMFLWRVDARADRQNVLLKVPQANCASHIPVVTFAAMSAEGVLNVEVDIDKQTITLSFDDDKSTIEQIKTALKKAGYHVAGEPVFIKK